MLVNAVPTLHAVNIDDTIAFYEAALGFTTRYREDGFAILYRDSVEITFTQHDDRYLAEHTSCRINVTDIDALYQEYKPKGVVHPNGDLRMTWWGTKDFGIIDLNGNGIVFSERVTP